MLYDFIVIGAGASGLFFAAHYESGPVLLLEAQERPGRKLLLSGGGKCNITNLQVRPENYIGSNPRFCRPALLAFPPERVIAYLNKHRIAWEEREHGQIFCRRGAEEVRDLLLSETEKRGAGLLTGQRIESVTALEAGWQYAPGRKTNCQSAGYPAHNHSPNLDENAHLDLDLDPLHEQREVNDRKAGNIQPASTRGGSDEPNLSGASPFSHPVDARFKVISNGKAHFSRNLLVATGNKAWPRSGSSTFGLSLAAAAGHALIPLRPGLTPLGMPPQWPLHGLQGISVTARVSLASGSGTGKEQTAKGKAAFSGTPTVRKNKAQNDAPSFTLPLLFTHHGLSGPACLQISSYLPEGDSLEIDFLPGLNLEQMLDAGENGRSNLQTLLRKHLPERLADALLHAGSQEAPESPKYLKSLEPPGSLDSFARRKVAELSRAQRRQAAAAVHRHTVRPEQPGFGQAESTVGGVSVDEINPASLESRLHPGLYFSGEVLDVCGWLGGYNLHWAWASARAVCGASGADQL